MAPSHLLWHRLAEGLSTSLRLAFASPPHFYGFYKNRTQKKATRDRGRSLKNFARTHLRENVAEANAEARARKVPKAAKCLLRKMSAAG